ncbi:MAG: pyruvate kinase, partial [Cytophagales bacterium]|nr:pyruvate kinase [Cytophagales bacterium]
MEQKFVATIGPASNNKPVLTELVKAGVDVFRLNFSHGSHEVHLGVIELIREINAELGTNVSILQDLQGPKIRTLEVENNGVEIQPLQELVITMDDVVGNAQRIGTTYKQLASDVEVGDMILIDDGNIELTVTGKRGNDVVTKVVHGGILKSRKGINLPDSNVSAPSLTEKDEEDLVFGLAQDVDWVALSFVRTASDIYFLREKIKQAGKETRIIAKIEKPEAIKNIDDIIEATDGVMVARGDLGVEIPMEKVPMYQKMIVDKCVKACKPVIIATQMMESMINNPRPTRAETNDVANAVLDGADAVMLSAETAAGKYPVVVVRAMVKIIAAVEEAGDIYDKSHVPLPGSELFYNDSLVLTACQLK